MVRTGFIAALAMSCALPLVAVAQIIPTIVPQTCSGADCTICHLVELIQNIINAGIFLSVFLSAIFFAYAGWLYVTSGIDGLGGQGNINTAKNIFWNVTVGLIIIMAGWLIVDTIMRTMVGNPGGNYLPWNKIC